jgi:hypothetical protein
MERDFEPKVSVVLIVIIWLAVMTAYFTTADCGPGMQSVQNVWRWPVCIAE